ncbi:MAG: nucleotide sugar dehydrogenase [bacterium]|nr:nucleotide sugar dehydrogenase [bacterium]
MYKNIGVIGLGYVGLPLAVEIGKKYPTIGLDINELRIAELESGKDRTHEVSEEELHQAKQLEFTSDINVLASCDLLIVTVPTPVDSAKKPDLTPIINATKAVGSILSKGATVVYESTVFPGCTEEVCVPILEKESDLKFNEDFFCGYSPERINPGDKERRVANIVKVVGGSTKEVGESLNRFYGSIITAGTHLTSSIKVAEASKVIENAQRDINIAFVNELAIIFEKLGIDSSEVLQAAGTKWNFLPFKPGLVGGHCIGVDPYYLTYKAEELGYNPQVILAGRRINDNMGNYVAQTVIKQALKSNINLSGSRFLIMGITFKEDCPDIRNSKVIDLVTEFEDYNVQVDVFDPHADKEEVLEEYGINLTNQPIVGGYEAVILAVAHKDFSDLNPRTFCKSNGILYDVKSYLPADSVDKRL